MPYTYDYPRPAVTVDIILIKADPSQRILLIKRGNDPFKNHWALPGGFVDEGEDLIDAAYRELNEETGIIVNELKQFKAYGRPGRDPRGHTVSIIFWQASEQFSNPIAADDAIDAKWFNVDDLPRLAFDHELIINEFLENHGS